MRQASGVRLMAHASGVRRQTHGSCVMRHASCVRLMAHASDSWLMRHASGVRRHASGVMRPASGVRRQTHGSCVMRQASHVHSAHSAAAVVGHDDNKAAAFPPMLLLLDLRPLSCTAWGNRVVLPTPYSSMGAIVRIKTGRGTHSNAAACCYSYEKGRHNAGPVPGGMTIRSLLILPVRRSP